MYKIMMDNTRKSATIYINYNNIILIKKTKYYKKKCVINVKIVSIVEFRKNKKQKTYIKNKNYKKKIF